MLLQRHTLMDVDKALSFAKTHCATDAKNHPKHIGGTNACDNEWLCAEFVYNCLKKGGLTVKKSGYNVARASELGIILKDYGTKIISSSTSTLKPSHFNNKLAKGDVVITVAKKPIITTHLVMLLFILVILIPTVICFFMLIIIGNKRMYINRVVQAMV